MHAYRITYRSFNRTTRHMGLHLATALGTSRWSALRAWWTIQRQWQNPCVQVVSVELNHSRCPHVQQSRGWTYGCAAFITA